MLSNKYIYLNKNRFDLTRTVIKMSLRSMKFMLLMLCSALKMYFFKMFMLFCQGELQLPINCMKLERTSSSFQVKRNILLKKCAWP